MVNLVVCFYIHLPLECNVTVCVKTIPFHSIIGLLMKIQKLTSPSSFSLLGRSLGVKVGIDGE